MHNAHVYFAAPNFKFTTADVCPTVPGPSVDSSVRKHFRIVRHPSYTLYMNGQVQSMSAMMVSQKVFRNNLSMCNVL